MSFIPLVSKLICDSNTMINLVNEKPNDYSIKQFHRAGKTYSLICRHVKIVIPKQIQKSLVEWFHNVICSAHITSNTTEFGINKK